MGIIINTTDFTGFQELAQNAVMTPKLNATIDRYEQQLIYRLLSNAIVPPAIKGLGDLFLADLDANGVPQSERFIKIFNPLTFQTGRFLRQSKGMVDAITSLVLYYYIGNTEAFSTGNGIASANIDAATKQKMAGSLRFGERRWNDAVRNIDVIQHWIHYGNGNGGEGNGGVADYPEFIMPEKVYCPIFFSIMTYKNSIIDILRSVIAKMQYSGTVKKIVSTSGKAPIFTYTINITDIFYMVVGYPITINGVQYTIISWCQLAHSWQIVVTGPSAPEVGQTYKVYPLYFYHGTPIEINNELGIQSNAFLKYPMIYLWETFKQTFYDSRFKATEEERDVPLKLFFLNDSEQNQNFTDDLYTKYVMPMTRMAELFLEECHKRPDLFYQQFDWKYDLENFPKFGMYKTEKGVPISLMSDKLSGVGLYITLRIRRPNTNCYLFTPLLADNGEILDTDKGSPLLVD